MIEPFSGPRYRENADLCAEDESPCVVCGRPIREPSCGREVCVVDGGARFARVDETVDTDDPGFMGLYPVGPECAKKLRKAGVL